METWEIIATAVGFAVGGTGFFFGLRYIIQTGFTKVNEDNARIVRGQEYLKEEIVKQERSFERVEHEVRQNRESFMNTETKMSNALESLANTQKELVSILGELRVAIVEDHSRQTSILERIVDRLDNIREK